MKNAAGKRIRSNFPSNQELAVNFDQKQPKVKKESTVPEFLRDLRLWTKD